MKEELQKLTQKEVVNDLVTFLDSHTLSLKSLHFLTFVIKVIHHIENYVIPQYGDYPDQMIDDFSMAEMASQVKRYAGRFGNNARGPVEDHRDTYKFAHYACYMEDKLVQRDDTNKKDNEVWSDGGNTELKSP